MKLVRAFAIAIAVLIPVAAIASPTVRASCCTGSGDCCPDCPFCLLAAHH
jgi:hypothetical protein